MLSRLTQNEELQKGVWWDLLCKEEGALGIKTKEITYAYINNLYICLERGSGIN